MSTELGFWVRTWTAASWARRQGMKRVNQFIVWVLRSNLNNLSLALACRDAHVEDTTWSAAQTLG